MAATKFETVDEYIASFPPEIQAVLESIREAIRQAVPDAHEKVSYQMPSFVMDGSLVYFGAFKRHIGMYGLSATTLDAFRDELGSRVTPKGTIQFPYAEPMPLGLIRDLVTARVNEKRAEAAQKATAT